MKATRLLDRGGATAVEFALITPILILLFVGIFDVCQLLLLRFRLDAAAASGANFALLQAKKVNSLDGPTLAGQIAALARSDSGSNVATVAVDLNHGPQASASGTANVVASGTATNADQCYCPQASPFAWGAGVSCGTACASNLQSGKFVRVTITRPYSALFSNYGMVSNGNIVATSTVQTQ